MASKYIKKFRVPEGFENLLNDFAKEVLRNQPKDILDFGVQYFKALEEKQALDYAHKGENRPENYRRPKNNEPNIISVPNNLEMSHEDKRRFQRSMDKLSDISKTDNFCEGPGGHITGQAGASYRDQPVKVLRPTDYEVNVKEEIAREEQGVEKPKGEGGYGKWFEEHSDGEEKKYNPEKKDVRDMAVSRSGDNYDEWFKQNREKSQNLEENENKPRGKDRYAEEGIKEGEGHDKGKGGDYGKWFNEHSDSEGIAYNPDKKDVRDSAVNRSGENYQQWFDEHKI